MIRSSRSRATEQLVGGLLLIVGFFTVAIIFWWMLMIASAPKPEVDPTGGVLPHCTHEIANAGGMCWGEPR